MTKESISRSPKDPTLQKSFDGLSDEALDRGEGRSCYCWANQHAAPSPSVDGRKR